MTRRLGAVLFAALLALACGKPRVDAKTSESLKRSLQKVRDSLPAAKRADFDGALGTIFMSQVSFDTLSKGVAGITAVGANLQQALDGKTAEEVIAYAEKLKKEHPNPMEQAWSRLGGLSGQTLSAGKLKANILEMTKAGVGTDVILRYARSVNLTAPLTAEQIVEWKNAGISDQVLSAVVGRPALP